MKNCQVNQINLFMNKPRTITTNLPPAKKKKASVFKINYIKVIFTK